MLYQVQWLITTTTWQTNITYLMEANDEAIVRTVCNKFSVAVFGLLEYTQAPETFWKAYFRFLFDKQTFTLYSQYEKAKDLYILFRDAGFTITYINNLVRPLPDADIPRVLEKLESDYAIAHKPKDEGGKSYIEQFTDMIVEQWTKELDKVKKLATRAIEDADQLISKTEDVKSTHLLKMKNEVEELKKLRLGTNISKLREQMSKVYMLMENVELQYLEEQKDNEIQIVEGSIVTYLDIVSEREKYRKTMNLQKAKAENGWAFNYYVVFGTMGLYQRLLGKDAQNKLNSVVVILNGLYDILIMFVMMTIIWLVLLQLFNSVAYKWTFFTSAFIDVGIMWICSAILMKFKKPHLVNLILLWPLCVGLYFLLHTFIYANFWL